MKTIPIQFNKGIQFPPKLGTLILKLAGEGKLAYGQNVESYNDEYGNGVITPGPALTTITNNSELTGVPFIRTFYGVSFSSIGYLYFGQSILGTKTVIRRVKDVLSGSTPSIDTSVTMTVNHSSHSNQELVDMIYRPDAANDPMIYVAGKDDTDTWVYKFSASSPSLNLVTANANFTGGATNQFFVVGSDNNLYWIGKNRVTSIDRSDTVTVLALANGLPIGANATAGVDWKGFLWIAYSSDLGGSFNARLSGGKAAVAYWNYTDASIETTPISAPCRYISAMVISPNGNLIVFGGLDEGKSSIYEFTGYGFNLLYTYIGDLPRSRHSIDFDGQGRLLWMTADGQFCRLDLSTGVFDHLGSITTGSSAGGLLAKAIGSPIGNDFLIASGSGSDYMMKIVSFGNYIGDGGESDTVATPLVVSGIQNVPYNSSISAITWHLTRPLQSGEKVILQVYENGSTTPTTYSTLDYSVDGAISSKRTVKTLQKINNFSLGILWKMTDNNATAPAVSGAEVEIN